MGDACSCDACGDGLSSSKKGSGRKRRGIPDTDPMYEGSKQSPSHRYHSDSAFWSSGGGGGGGAGGGERSQINAFDTFGSDPYDARMNNNLSQYINVVSMEYVGIHDYRNASGSSSRSHIDINNNYYNSAYSSYNNNSSEDEPTTMSLDHNNSNNSDKNSDKNSKNSNNNNDILEETESENEIENENESNPHSTHNSLDKYNNNDENNENSYESKNNSNHKRKNSKKSRISYDIGSIMVTYSSPTEMDQIEVSQLINIIDLMQLGYSYNVNYNNDVINNGGGNVNTNSKNSYSIVDPITVSDHKYGKIVKKTFKNSFIARDFLQWLIKYRFVSNIENAIYLGNTMINFKLIETIGKQGANNTHENTNNAKNTKNNAKNNSKNDKIVRFSYDNAYATEKNEQYLMFGRFIVDNPLPNKQDRHKVGGILQIMTNLLDIEDRYYNGKKYEACFITQECVNLFVKWHVAKNRVNAVNIGQLLNDWGYIKCLTKKKTFETGYHLCKFTKKTKKLLKIE